MRKLFFCCVKTEVFQLFLNYLMDQQKKLLKKKNKIKHEYSKKQIMFSFPQIYIYIFNFYLYYFSAKWKI